MKSNTLLWAAILVVACLSSWLILDLNQKVQNLEYALEASVRLDDKQTEALVLISQNLQDVVSILHDYEAFIENNQITEYEQ